MGLTALNTWKFNVPTGFGIHQACFVMNTNINLLKANNLDKPSLETSVASDQTVSHGGCVPANYNAFGLNITLKWAKLYITFEPIYKVIEALSN